MTLTQMLRPVQKQVGRLLLAGTNNAVDKTAAVDAANFPQQPQIQPQAQQPQPSAAEALPGCVPGAAVVAPFGAGFGAPFTLPPVAAQASFSQGAQGGQADWADAQGQHGRWAGGASGEWVVAGMPAWWGQGGADQASAGLAPVTGAAALARGQSFGSTGLWHVDPRWRQLDARWPVSGFLMPVLFQMPPQQGTPEPSVSSPTATTTAAPAAATAASTASTTPPAAASLLGVLRGRTGASRRQRRKHQQHQQQLQLQRNNQGGAYAPALDAEWGEAAAWVTPSPVQAFAASAELNAAHTAGLAQGEALEGELESTPSLLAEEAGSSTASTRGGTTATEVAPDDISEADSSKPGNPTLLFPPTPESTPCNSPRVWHNMARYWQESSPTHLALVEVVQQAHYGQAEAEDVTPAPAEAECEAALAQLRSGDPAVKAEAMQRVTGSAWALALSAAGCRVVQVAFEAATASEQVALAEQLRGRVREASASPHANHVLQKCIQLLPPERLQFVLEEMRGHSANAARHRYGCRVLERLIEYCPASHTQPIVEEVLANAGQLCRHTFGNFVVQHVLEHGTAPQKHAVVDLLHADIQRLARHRVASHVVRSALVHCTSEDRVRLVTAMRADAGELADLAHHHCGSFVVREMRRQR